MAAKQQIQKMQESLEELKTQIEAEQQRQNAIEAHVWDVYNYLLQKRNANTKP